MEQEARAKTYTAASFGTAQLPLNRVWLVLFDAETK